MEFIGWLDLGFSWEVSRVYSLLRCEAGRLVGNCEGAYCLHLQDGCKKTVLS